MKPPLSCSVELGQERELGKIMHAVMGGAELLLTWRASARKTGNEHEGRELSLD